MAALPIHEFCKGHIRIRIWRKKTGNKLTHTVSAVRLFRRNGFWNESTRFQRDEIPLVLLALDEAHTWIFQKSGVFHE